MFALAGAIVVVVLILPLCVSSRGKWEEKMSEGGISEYQKK